MYTSLKLSQWIKEKWCKIWFQTETDWNWCIWWDKCEKEWTLIHKDDDSASYTDYYQAYDLIYDVCIKYRKEFWWADWIRLSPNVLAAIQLWKVDWAEEIIMRYSLFNN